MPIANVGTPIRAKCLSEGECDAVPLGQPDDIVFAQKGFTKLGDSLEVIPVLQFNVIAARADWAATNKDLVTRFARAFGDAYRFIRDPGNRDEVTRILAETTDAPADVARAMLAFYYEPDRGVMPRQAEISLPGVGILKNASRAPLRWSHGLVRERGQYLYVTSGIGTSGVPLRWRVPPEFVVLDVTGPPDAAISAVGAATGCLSASTV